MSNKNLDLYTFVNKLKGFWHSNGCAILEPFNMEVGAGTFHPATVFGSLGEENAGIAYLQNCIRPSDGRYGGSPNRLQSFYQFQTLLKPAPENIIDIYLSSLEELGIDTKLHDIRFVEDDWESPTLGAFGVGWEVWCDGMEITQFTYFQQIGGQVLKNIPIEITYGVERLLMYVLGIDNVYDLPWNINPTISYGSLTLEQEKQSSYYNFEYANIDNLVLQFKMACDECKFLLGKKLYFPAYNMAAKSSHYFNLLDSRGYLGVADRAHYIQIIQDLVKSCCSCYLEQQKCSD